MYVEDSKRAMEFLKLNNNDGKSENGDQID
jgi:hypothetical protein